MTADKYEITCDLFTLPYKEDCQILYAPKLGYVCAANNDLVNLLSELDTMNPSSLNQEQRAALDYLDQKGVLNGSKEVSLSAAFQEKYSPTMVTLFPTNQCNLKCTYCYASAGDTEPLMMDWHYAISAIDRVIENLKEKNMQVMSLGFHGGGEPLFPWQFISRIVEYAEEECAKAGLKLTVFSATNGMLNEQQLEWIVKHFQSLNISFDGLPHVQDYHRPTPNGKGSFEVTDRTMRFLDACNFNYGIRSTISSYNIDLMEESLEFIGQNYKCKQVHFEPLFFCGRCKTNDSLKPDLERFSDNFQKCASKCKEFGINLTYSGCRIETLTDSFCGVAKDNFSVTPDGFITTCYEVTSKNDPKSTVFIIGNIGQDGELNIDENKRRFLQSLTVDNMEYCTDCFAKWHCAGECASKLGHSDYIGVRGNERCELNRKLTAGRIIGALEGTYFHPFMQNLNHIEKNKEATDGQQTK